MPPSGKVYLVGAGPGDPGLLTRRGEDVLRRADVVLFDALAPEELLDLAPPRAQRIYVGKRAGHHSHAQSDINTLLVEHAREGRTVVRLKGGDPFVYGRGAEEALACRAEGIDVEFIPGVTSAIAVPALAGIPVLQRGLAGTVLILHGRLAAANGGATARAAVLGAEEETGPHARPTKTLSPEEIARATASRRQGPLAPERRGGIVLKRRNPKGELTDDSAIARLVRSGGVLEQPSAPVSAAPTLEAEEEDALAVDWKAVCRAADTLVFLMPMGSLEAIRDGLTEGGRPPSEPVACIQWGTTARQRTLVSAVADFPEAVREAALGAPTLLIVGEVVNLRDQLNFFEESPLFGWRAGVLTGNGENPEPLCRELRAAGVQARAFSVAIGRPVVDAGARLRAMLPELRSATHVLFPHLREVEAFVTALRTIGLDFRALPEKARLIARNRETLEALERMGLRAEAVEQAETSGVREEVVPRAVLIGGDPDGALGPWLRRLGLKPKDLVLSEPYPDQNACMALLRNLREGNLDLLVFQSSAAALALGRFLAEQTTRLDTSQMRFAAANPAAARAVEELGLPRPTFTTDGDPAALARELARLRAMEEPAR